MSITINVNTIFSKKKFVFIFRRLSILSISKQVLKGSQKKLNNIKKYMRIPHINRYKEKGSKACISKNKYLSF